MRPNIWMDVYARKAVRNGEVATPPKHTRSGILTALHDIFHDTPHHYAIAVPRELRGAGIRVFMSDMGDAEALKSKLAQNRFILANAEVGKPHRVPEDFDGTWTAWLRYRVEGDCPEQTKRRQLFARRMRFDWFEMVSLSTGGRRFSLYVQTGSGSKPEGECLPNSFGLTNGQQPFALPDVSAFA